MNYSWLIFLFLSVSLGPAQTSQTPQSKDTNSSSDAKAGVNTIPDSTRVEPVHVVSPAYPLEGEQHKLQGLVAVRAVISQTGEVEGTTALSGDPVLARAAEDAVKEWKFKPFIKNGVATKITAVLPFDFIFCDKPTGSDATSDPTTSEAMKIVWASKTCRGRKTKDVMPNYPAIAKVGRIQGVVVLFAIKGVVVLFAIIGKDGSVRQVNVISGHPLLTQARVDAVKQWRYSPYVLNGKAVEIQTKITVGFSLSGPPALPSE